MSKVLIIEDEVAIADLEKDYLELSGFEVETENDGVVGLKRALSEDFDMYILDLMLPGIDGFEICKQIREEKKYTDPHGICQKKTISIRSGDWDLARTITSQSRSHRVSLSRG